MTTETPASIAAWSRETFGRVRLEKVASRALEEMAELISHVSERLPSPEAIADESADVVIVLCRLVADCGDDLWDVVEGKMAVNRARSWDGQYHR